jgi:hypothetical protein
MTGDASIVAVASANVDTMANFDNFFTFVPFTSKALDA